MSRPKDLKVTDMKGESLEIGDRVYIAPRSYGGKGDVCVTSPCFDDQGEEIKKQSIRGRISEIMWSDKHDCAIIAVDQPKGGTAVIYPDLAKKQAGRTQAEKESALHARRADKLKEIRRKQREEGKIKDVPDLVVKPRKRRAKRKVSK
jgi:hypothetical protein